MSEIARQQPRSCKASGGVIQPHFGTEFGRKVAAKNHLQLTTNFRVGFPVGECTHRFPLGETV